MRPNTASLLMRLSSRLVVVLLAATGIGLAGCAGNKTSRRDLTLITPEQAQQAIKVDGGWINFSKREGGVWVDPRTMSQFVNEHIPGAIHMPFENVRDKHDRLYQFEVVIVYGSDYNAPIAEAMSKRLIELGHRNVQTLRGGLRAWKDAGNDVEKGRPTTSNNGQAAP